eukprot:COSAG01_NODE_13751_length_1541_cov_1.127601_3_plen_64_part_00
MPDLAAAAPLPGAAAAAAAAMPRGGYWASASRGSALEAPLHARVLGVGPERTAQPCRAEAVDR